MITIYKDKKDISQNMEYVELNDIFFNKNTASKLDERANEIIKKIDDAKLISKYKIESRFNGAIIDVDQLSSGCKTALNILYFPDKVFCIKECGDNALEILYKFEQGAVCSDYAVIPFDMDKVLVCSGERGKVIDDYEELKEWWSNED